MEVTDFRPAVSAARPPIRVIKNEIIPQKNDASTGRASATFLSGNSGSYTPTPTANIEGKHPRGFTPEPTGNTAWSTSKNANGYVNSASNYASGTNSWPAGDANIGDAVIEDMEQEESIPAPRPPLPHVVPNTRGISKIHTHSATRLLTRY